MSLFAQGSVWGGSCSNPNQSPINLSQSGSKECHLTCDLVMDDGFATQGTVSNSTEGLVVLPSKGTLGSCKLNGDGYNCVALQINHPSHHTIEGIQADGEVIALFQNATGDTLCVSSLFRVHSAQTESWSFFHQLVPYVDSTTERVPIMFQSWSLSQMVPPDSSYFYYEGTTVIPQCTSAKWVVFQRMINMDQTDFALLVKTVQAGSRPVQPLGDREVFFNDSKQLSGGAMPHDNKTYIRCRPAGGKRQQPYTVKRADLKSTDAKERLAEHEDTKHPKTMLGKSKKMIGDYVDQNGWIGFMGMVLIILAIGMGIVMGRRLMHDEGMLVYLPKLGYRLGHWVRSLFVKEKSEPSIA
jgi:carbonic anhydrase